MKFLFLGVLFLSYVIVRLSLFVSMIIILFTFLFVWMICVPVDLDYESLIILLLEDTNFTEYISECTGALIECVEHFPSVKLWWDFFKNSTKADIVSFAKHKNLSHENIFLTNEIIRLKGLLRLVPFMFHLTFATQFLLQSPVFLPLLRPPCLPFPLFLTLYMNIFCLKLPHVNFVSRSTHISECILNCL